MVEWNASQREGSDVIEGEVELVGREGEREEGERGRRRGRR